MAHFTTIHRLERRPRGKRLGYNLHDVEMMMDSTNGTAPRIYADIDGTDSIDIDGMEMRLQQGALDHVAVAVAVDMTLNFRGVRYTETWFMGMDQWEGITAWIQKRTAGLGEPSVTRTIVAK